jgi:hypothetical protein
MPHGRCRKTGVRLLREEAADGRRIQLVERHLADRRTDVVLDELPVALQGGGTCPVALLHPQPLVKPLPYRPGCSGQVLPLLLAAAKVGQLAEHVPFRLAVDPLAGPLALIPADVEHRREAVGGCRGWPR